jgi:hypothetical protein
MFLNDLEMFLHRLEMFPSLFDHFPGLGEIDLGDAENGRKH